LSDYLRNRLSDKARWAAYFQEVEGSNWEIFHQSKIERVKELPVYDEFQWNSPSTVLQ
jgi:hypothetical protein